MYCAKHVKRNYSINEWNRKTEKRNKTRRRGNNFNRMSELVIELGQEKPSSEPTSPLYLIIHLLYHAHFLLLC